MTFKENFKQLDRTLSVSSLAILVWGPGKNSEKKHFEKREKIRDELKKNFPYSEVHFSEDPELSDLVPEAPHLPLQQQELWHLAACDLCVVLDTAKGPGEEIAHFTASRYAYKLMILTHQKYENATSFPAALRPTQNQIFYSEHEYDSCSLVGRVIDRVKTVALCKEAGISPS